MLHLVLPFSSALGQCDIVQCGGVLMLHWKSTAGSLLQGQNPHRKEPACSNQRHARGGVERKTDIGELRFHGHAREVRAASEASTTTLTVPARLSVAPQMERVAELESRIREMQTEGATALWRTAHGSDTEDIPMTGAAVVLCRPISQLLMQTKRHQKQEIYDSYDPPSAADQRIAEIRAKIDALRGRQGAYA